MISVCNVNNEAKFTALLALRAPGHHALNYNEKGSDSYNTIMKWFNIRETTVVFEQVVRTHNGVLYLPAKDAFIDFEHECYRMVNMLTVLNIANASTNNSQLLESMTEVDTSFSSLIVESNFDDGVLAEARQLGFIGPKFEINPRLLV